MNPNFEDYHRKNPKLYELIIKFTMLAREAGFKHYSMQSIMERVRWHVNIETRDPEGFKINHNYRQDYSLKVMQEYPWLEGFFRVRFKNGLRNEPF